jgi:dihydroneopterin aldolase
MLEAYFNESELRTLCFDLEVDYDNLRHATKADAVRELIGYLERRDRVPELVAVGQQLRPDVSWVEIPPFGQATA